MKTQFCSFLLCWIIFCEFLPAQSVCGYRSLDVTNPIELLGNKILYEGKEIELGEKTFFIDGQLSDEVTARYPLFSIALMKQPRLLLPEQKQSL